MEEINKESQIVEKPMLLLQVVEVKKGQLAINSPLPKKILVNLLLDLMKNLLNQEESSIIVPK